MTDQSVSDFYEQHAAGGPDCVVVAHVYFDDGERIGIFRSLDRAHAWADNFEHDETCRGAVFAPYVIDIPDFGNVPREMQQ